MSSGNRSIYSPYSSVLVDADYDIFIHSNFSLSDLFYAQSPKRILQQWIQSFVDDTSITVASGVGPSLFHLGSAKLDYFYATGGDASVLPFIGKHSLREVQNAWGLETDVFFRTFRRYGLREIIEGIRLLSSLPAAQRRGIIDACVLTQDLCYVERFGGSLPRVRFASVPSVDPDMPAELSKRRSIWRNFATELKSKYEFIVFNPNRLSHDKGGLSTILGYRDFCKINPRFEACLIVSSRGDLWADEVCSSVLRELMRQGRLVVIPLIPPDQLSYFYEISDVTLGRMPGTTYSYHLSGCISEALCFGVPLFSDTPNNLLQESGTIYPHYSVSTQEDITIGFETFVTNKGKLGLLGREGRRWYRENFNLRVSEWISLLGDGWVP